MSARPSQVDPGHLARHYALSTLRAVATTLPDGARARADRLLGGLGPTVGDAEALNDWSGRPSAEHPRPVILLHGTNDTPAVFENLGRTLRDAGYVVFFLGYGRDESSARGRAGGGGTGDIVASAREVAAFVERVLEATGVDQVDFVGHSQGGLHAHAYVHGLGLDDEDDRQDGDDASAASTPAYAGAAHVGRVVTLGSTLRGASPLGPADRITHLPGVRTALDAFLGPSARQQVRGSDIIRRLARLPDAAPGVQYTSIVSRRDATVRPQEAQHLTPGPSVTNIWVQDVFPDSTVSHADMPQDPEVHSLILEALAD